MWPLKLILPIFPSLGATGLDDYCSLTVKLMENEPDPNLTEISSPYAEFISLNIKLSDLISISIKYTCPTLLHVSRHLLLKLFFRHSFHNTGDSYFRVCFARSSTFLYMVSLELLCTCWDQIKPETSDFTTGTDGYQRQGPFGIASTAKQRDSCSLPAANV